MEVDDYINIEPLERLGIEIAELPEDAASEQARQNQNTNVMGESALLIVPCVDPRDAGEHAWILLWQHPECVPFWEWGGRDYGDLGEYLDQIIALTKHFKLPLFVPIDTVTFRDDSNRIKNRNVPAGVNKLRAWLMKEYEFMSLGPSPNQRGEILCLEPEQPPMTEDIPESLRLFFDEIENRLQDAADIVWFQREKRRILASIQFSEKSKTR